MTEEHDGENRVQVVTKPKRQPWNPQLTELAIRLGIIPAEKPEGMPEFVWRSQEALRQTVDYLRRQTGREKELFAEYGVV